MYIRKGNYNDLDAIMSIWFNTNISAHNFIPETYWKKHFDEVMSAVSSAEVYVYDENGIKGFVGIIENFIAGIFVKEEYQSTGIGSKLIKFLQSIKCKLMLNVYEQNQVAVKFYIKHNFHIIEKTIDERTENPEYTMIWKL